MSAHDIIMQRSEGGTSVPAAKDDDLTGEFHVEETPDNGNGINALRLQRLSVSSGAVLNGVQCCHDCVALSLDELPVEEVKTWLTDAGIMHIFELFFYQHEEALHGIEGLRGLFETRLDPSAAKALARTFVQFRGNPPNLSCKGENAVLVHVLGQGSTASVFVKASIQEADPAKTANHGPSLTVLKQFKKDLFSGRRLRDIFLLRERRAYEQLRALHIFYQEQQPPHSHLPAVPLFLSEPDYGAREVSCEMAYLPGYDMEKVWQARGSTPFSVRSVCEFAKQAAWAMSLRHKADPNLIHRDIKPANIHITDRGRISELDHGLARRGGDNDNKVTDPNSICGTPLFAAQELLNSSADVDVRADVFSLGLMVTKMLTGNYAYVIKDTALETMTERIKTGKDNKPPELTIPSPDDAAVAQDPKLAAFWKRF
ncbi:hypothetical protein EXS70_05215, partial [Candidatus Peribacteria bacterium]|nr:hypothetical protein [Candidatus Peribacteria bacterium]